MKHKTARRRASKGTPYRRHSLGLEQLESRQLLCADVAGIIQAFNAGLDDVREPGQISGIVNRAFGTDLPLLEETVAELSSAATRFATPFLQDLQNTSLLSGVQANLAALGFQVEYLNTTPDANGDLLRATFQRTWNPTNAPATFGLATGFEYFDAGVDGNLAGSISAGIEPVTLSVTLGVDVDSQCTPSFFLAESSSLTVGGVSLTGFASANLGIRNLLDVDVTGPVSGNFGGVLAFVDGDTNTKLRTDQLADPAGIVSTTLSGSFSFNPSLTATLPVIGDISWSGSWTASVNNGSLQINAPTLNAPSVASVEQLLVSGYQAIVGAFDLFGGADVFDELPVVDQGLGDVLGLPSFLTGGGVGGNGFSVSVTPQTVLDLINGDVVDLIRFQVSDRFMDSEIYSVFLGGGVIPLGPVPLTATFELITGIEYGWSYHVGLGVDTSGFYIDPTTSIAATGSVIAGLQADLSLLGLLTMQLTGGVGASISLAAGFQDPDPRDGRIYLDELVNLGATGAGTSLLDAMAVTLDGEAFGFARGLVSLLFWEWEVFNERFTIADFGGQLSSNNRSPMENPNSQRNVTGRAPLGRGELDAGLLQNGTLMIDTRGAAHSSRSNAVSITQAANGEVDVTWRGVGRRVFQPGEIQNIVLVGNEQADRFYVGSNVVIPVTAYGNGGNDLISVETAPANIYGGDGDDILRGGSIANAIYGEGGDDQLRGGDGDDYLDGGDGNDRLEGGDGDDALLGGSGTDVLFGGLGNDDLQAGAGDDILYGGFGFDLLQGGDGRDVLYGEQDDDTLQGGNDDDQLIGGSGSDQLRGGEGNDTLFGDRAYGEPVPGQPDGNDLLFGEGGDDRLFGEGGNDLLDGDQSGQSGNDILVGDAGIDVLLGRGGDDYLIGGAGADELNGGDGDDVLNGGLDADILRGEAGEDTLQIDFASADGTTDSFSGGLDRDQLAVVGTVQQVLDANNNPVLSSDINDHIQIEQLSADNFRARNLDPTTGAVLQTFLFTLDSSLAGDIEQLGMQGLGGDDTLEMLTGALDGKNTVIDGGEGNDTLRGGQGRDTLYGGPGDDRLFGGDGDDALYGDAGRDELFGEGGIDLLDAGPGGDRIVGTDREVIRGGPDDDYLIAGTGFLGSVITGDGGNDTIIGSSGEDDLDGGDGNDLILGGDFDDVIRGGAGDDILVGELGRDSIDGGDGDDRIYTHLNNEIRVSLGLEPIAEITDSERQNRVSRLIAERVILQQELNVLVALCNVQCSPEQQERRTDLTNFLAIIDLQLVDLDDCQVVSIDTAQGGNGADSIVGSPYYDSLLGGDGDDDIYPMGGCSALLLHNQDLVRGENGMDTLWFEATAGDDTILVFGRPYGAGNLEVAVDLNGDSIVDGVLRETTIENIGILGLAGDDVISVNFGNQALAGVRIDAGSGDDWVDVGALQSKAQLVGGDGNDLLIGGLNDDEIRGDAGDDVLEGRGGRDAIFGGVDNDRIIGGEGDDFLDAGIGSDFVSGDTGNDTILAGAGPDDIDPGQGDDYVVYTFGRDSLSPPIGNDTLVDVPDPASEPRIFAGAEFFVDAFVDPRPTVAMAADGSSVVTWNLPDGSEVGVFARRYDPFGQPIGNLIQVNTTTDNYQGLPQIAMDRSNNFVIVWQSFSSDGSQIAIVARRFDATGRPLGPEIPVSQSASPVNEAPKIAMADDGRFVVTWVNLEPGAVCCDVYARTFDTVGQATSDEFRVSTAAQGAQEDASVGISADGRFVIVWRSDHNGGDRDIYGQRFEPAGQRIGPEFRANTITAGTQSRPAVAMLPDGRFAVAFQSDAPGATNFDVFLRGFDNNGIAGVPETRISAPDVNSNTPKIALRPDGIGLASWVRLRSDGFDTEVVAVPVRVTPSGLAYALDEEFVVNSTRLGSQSKPALSVNSEGRAIVVWHSEAGTSDVRAKQLILEPQARSFRLLQLSEPARLDSDPVFQDVGRWRLDRDGTDVSHLIQQVYLPAADPLSQFSDALFQFSEDLVPGTYRLTGDDIALNLEGRPFNTAFNDYVETFSINPVPLPLGAEISTSISQGEVRHSAVAVNPVDQSYVLVWSDTLPGSANSDIYSQRFDASGTPISVPVRVNTFTPDDQVDPAIAMDANGNYVIVWDTLGLAVGHVPYFRRFAADGTPRDAQQFPVSISPSFESTTPRVAVDADGDFAVAWTSDQRGFVQRFNRHGLPTGPQIRVIDDPISPNQVEPEIAMDANGNFVVTWNDPSTGVWIRWFSESGVGETPYQIDTGAVGGIGGDAQTSPSVAMNRAGEFAAVWRFNNEVWARRYDSQRQPTSAPFQVSALDGGDYSFPDVQLDDDGNMLVVSTVADSTYGDRVASRWFDRWGNLLTDEVRFGSLSVAGGSATAAMTPEGEYVVLWPTENVAGGTDIALQRFTLLPPTVPDVAPGSDGSSIVVAFSQSMATSGAGSVLIPQNWALQLPDGRFLVQDDPQISGFEPLVTPEQFGDITFGFNATTQQWEATLPLNFTLGPGNYRLIARSSLQDAAGRQLDGNGDGVPSENYIAEFTVSPDCDFDNDGDCDLADIDALVAEIAAGGTMLTFDLTGDGLVNLLDRDQWLVSAGAVNLLSGNPYLLGDANLDGVVDGSDFGRWNANKFTTVAAWSAGDFNADGVVDGSDFGIWNANKFTSSDAANTVVSTPLASATEPATPRTPVKPGEPVVTQTVNPAVIAPNVSRPMIEWRFDRRTIERDETREIDLVFGSLESQDWLALEAEFLSERK